MKHFVDQDMEQAGAASPMPRILTLAGITAILVGAFIAYGPALQGGFLWDDDRYVSENPLLRADDGLRRIWTTTEAPQYYPLVFTSFRLEARLWGLSAYRLHVVNVVLHVAAALLLWRVQGRLPVPGSWLAAAVFALHPVNVESVAWITERKNVLSGMFYLAAFSAYLRFVDAGSRRSYLWSLVLYVCALLSKTVTCTLPIALLLCHWWRRGRVGKRELLPLLPYLGLGLAFGLTTAWLEKHHVGAVGNEWDLSFVERSLVAGRALWFYAGKLLWPVNLIFNYPRWEIDAGAAWQYLFCAAALLTGTVLWFTRNRIGRGPFAAAAFFTVTLTPALGFIDVYPFRFSYVADHFVYHAGMGFIALISAVVVVGLRKLPLPGMPSPTRITLIALVVPVACGVLAFRQAHMYADAETLWRRTIERNPRSWLAQYNLGVLLWLRGEVSEAERQYREALAINPRHAVAHVNLGNIAAERGDYDQAMARYEQALAVAPDEPTALYNLAKEFSRRGAIDRAIGLYRASIQADPTISSSHNNLGLLLLETGDPDQARYQFEQAIRYDPKNAGTVYNLGVASERAGDPAEALGYYGRALAIDPRFVNAWYRSAACWRKAGRIEKAETAYRNTLDLAPGHTAALAELATIDYKLGRFKEAAAGYRRVLELNPTNGQSCHNLSAIYRQMGRYADAADVLEEGVRADPANVALLHDLARLLAGCPDENVRDGGRAVRLALQVVDRLDSPSPEALATLAAAYAESGDPARARVTLDRAIGLARSQKLDTLAERLVGQRRSLPSGPTSSTETPRDSSLRSE